jgi:hypothetical protein
MKGSLPLFFGLIGLWLALLCCEIVSPFFFLHDDNAMQLVPLYMHDFQVLTQTGRLAEINFFQFGGEPFIEEGQTAVLYPPTYLCTAFAAKVIGNARWTIELMAFFHLALGFTGFYAWMRQADADRWPAVLGALAWALNPFVLILGSCWLAVIMLAGYLPWIFWAMDRLLLRPALSHSIALGGFLGIFFLAGVPQWAAYAVLFLMIYTTLKLLVNDGLRFRQLLYSLIISALVFLTITLPLLFPMLHALQVSDQRSFAMPWQAALAGSIQIDFLVMTQFGIFLPKLVFEGSSAILFCPALWLLPVAALWYFRADTISRRKLLPFWGLALATFAFSTPLHALLNLLPVFNRYRWPFKVFIYAELFFTALVVLSLVSWAASNVKRKQIAHLVLLLVIAANLIFSLCQHDRNYLSVATLTSLENPVSVVNPQLGRVATFGEVHATVTRYYLTQNYATLFHVPSIGGYNALMGRDQSLFGVGIVDHAIDYSEVTPEIRAKLDARAVRYWIVDTRTPIAEQIKAMPDLRLIESAPHRMIYENMRARPMVYAPHLRGESSLSFTYAGNSMLIPLDAVTGPVVASLSPTDGWWYRLDGGSWLRPTYRDDRVQVEVTPSAKLLEISYFDPYLRQGLLAALVALVILGALFGLRARITD